MVAPPADGKTPAFNLSGSNANDQDDSKPNSDENSDGEEERKPIAWDALSEVDSEEDVEELEDLDDEDYDSDYDDEIMDCDEEDYDDSDYDEDYSDDEDDNPFMPDDARDMFHAFMDHMAAQMAGGEDDDDEDDDESNHCDCPRCTARRMMRAEGENFCDCTECRRERGEIDSDDDSLSSGDSMPPLEDGDGKVVPGTESNEKKDTCEDVDDGPHCAICFTPFSACKPKVLLPCCGKAEGECESTMVFCEKCIVKTIIVKDREEIENRYGPFASFMLSKSSKEAKLGECPRCRKLISVTKTPFTIKEGTFEDAIRFAVDRGDKQMRELLFVLAFVHYHYVPFELLEKDVTRVSKLCQLGILSAVKSEKLYKLDPVNQAKLYKYMTTKEMRPAFPDSDDKPITDEDKWLSQAYLAIVMEHLQAALLAIKAWQVRVAIRLAHQAAIMGWKYLKIMPKQTAYELGTVLSAAAVLFNVFVVSLALIVAIFGGLEGGRKTFGKMALVFALCSVCRYRLGVGLWRFVGASMLVPLRIGAKLLQQKFKKLSLDLMSILIWVAYGFFIFDSLATPDVKDQLWIEGSLATAAVLYFTKAYTDAADKEQVPGVHV
ncbi:MAG: hypothetical protein SGARI_001851 [Bacillariaceae sp.]